MNQTPFSAPDNQTPQNHSILSHTPPTATKQGAIIIAQTSNNRTTHQQSSEDKREGINIFCIPIPSYSTPVPFSII
jgi:hypothetical protein